MAKQEADITTAHPPNGERFAVMDEMGVDMQLVCPAAANATTPSPSMSRAGARALNDGIAEYVGKRPTAWSRSAACRCRTATRRPRSSSAA